MQHAILATAAIFIHLLANTVNYYILKNNVLMIIYIIGLGLHSGEKCSIHITVVMNRYYSNYV
jgi:hypothetical protein